MANRNAKLIERTLKDFSLGVMEGGGSGTKVVTELPDVGEEHVVYELQEKKVSQSLVPMFNKQMRDDHVLGDIDYCFVFETSEEMTNTFNSIVPTEESGDIYLNYITEEDKLIGAVYVKGAWKFTEARKMSNCKFSVGDIFELEDDAFVVILKEYTGEVQGGIGYHGVLFNDEPYLFEQKTTGILLGTPTIGDMEMCGLQEELPEIPEDAPSEYVFETIPYEKIINYQLENDQWYFTPKGSGEVTVTSYWIYTNDEWVNVDKAGEPKYFSVCVTSQHMRGLSNIPLDEVSFYLGEKELQLIKLTNDGEKEFGCLLVPITNKYNNIYSVTMKLTNEALSLLGGDSNLFINPTFVSYEDPINVGLDSSISEYDFELLLGTLTIFNGNML